MSDLKTFLKQHSAIPNAFVDSFLSMYNPDTIQTDLVIDIEKVSKWLNAGKGELVRTLKTSYKESIDYTITRGLKRSPTKKFGGNNYIKVMITPDCFKRLCMRSNSKRAEEVRTYFIELESLLVRYRAHMLKGMDMEIKQLENAVKPKDVGDSAGFIYVIKANPARDSVYKIGRTADLNKRLSTYSTGTIDGVDLVYKFRTDSHKATEACIKAMLKENQYRKYKEVYQANIDMIKALIAKCDDLVKYKRLYANARVDNKMTGGYYIVLEKDAL